MTEFKISSDILDSVRGKVVVLTGGAQGIGGATVSQLYHLGAHVYFGDWDENTSNRLVDDLRSSPSTGHVAYLKVDVRDYQSQLALFDAAYLAHGRVDMAIYCAGVTERPGFWEPPNLNLEAVRVKPTAMTDVIDINLTGAVLFARLAAAHLKEKHSFDKSTDGHNIVSPKCITLVASVAGFKEAPGISTYAATKHGIVGLMRALRLYISKLYGIRINAICPWATDTQLFAGVHAEWMAKKMPINTPLEVARYTIQATADPMMNGKALYITGGNAVDIEEGLNRTEPQWLGAQNCEDLKKGQEILGVGIDWGTNQEW